MSSTKKISSFCNTSDWGRRYQLLYLLHTRMAAGIENQEPGVGALIEQIRQDSDFDPKDDPMSLLWTKASDYFDNLIDVDPASALKLALVVTTLPVKRNPNTEAVFKWVRGDGPICAAKEKLLDWLVDYLCSNPKADRVTKRIKKYMSRDLSAITTPEQAFADANCFLAISSMLLASKLSGRYHPTTDDLFSLAEERLKDPHVTRIVSIYAALPDTAWLAQELKPFLSG